MIRGIVSGLVWISITLYEGFFYCLMRGIFSGFGLDKYYTLWRILLLFDARNILRPSVCAATKFPLKICKKLQTHSFIYDLSVPVIC